MSRSRSAQSEDSEGTADARSAECTFQRALSARLLLLERFVMEEVYRLHHSDGLFSNSTSPRSGSRSPRSQSPLSRSTRERERERERERLQRALRGGGGEQGGVVAPTSPTTLAVASSSSRPSYKPLPFPSAEDKCPPPAPAPLLRSTPTMLDDELKGSSEDLPDELPAQAYRSEGFAPAGNDDNNDINSDLFSPRSEKECGRQTISTEVPDGMQSAISARFKTAGSQDRVMAEVEMVTSLSSRETNTDDPTTAASCMRLSKLEQVLETVYNDGAQNHKEYLFSKKRDTLIARFYSDANFQSNVIDMGLTIFIFINVVTMGLSTDLYRDWSGWQVMEIFFTLVFTVALLLKASLVGLRELLCGADKYWNWFEVVQMSVGLAEMFFFFFQTDSQLSDDVSMLALLRISRSIRVTRLLRVCRVPAFNDLVVMVNGTCAGMKTLGWAGLLTAMPIYALAIMFRETLGQNFTDESGSENFGTMSDSFFTVFRCTVSGECSDIYGRPILKLVAANHGWVYPFIFCLMESFMTFGLYNVVQGIFLENVLASARANDLAVKRERLRNQDYFAEKMMQLLEIVVHTCNMDDMKPNGTFKGPSREDMIAAAADLEITPEILEEVRLNPQFQAIMRDLAVAEEDSSNLFETLDADGGGTIDLHEFVEGIAKLRGEPRRSDIIAVNFMLQKVQLELKDFGEATFKALAAQEKTVKSLKRTMKQDLLARGTSSQSIGSTAATIYQNHNTRRRSVSRVGNLPFFTNSGNPTGSQVVAMNSEKSERGRSNERAQAQGATQSEDEARSPKPGRLSWAMFNSWTGGAASHGAQNHNSGSGSGSNQLVPPPRVLSSNHGSGGGASSSLQGMNTTTSSADPASASLGLASSAVSSSINDSSPQTSLSGSPRGASPRMNVPRLFQDEL